MEILLLKKDGRCRWLENKVLNDLLPMASRAAVNPFAKTPYMIVNWISNDQGRIGVDLKWFKSLGVPAVPTYQDLPQRGEFKVINTGYDSIVDEEQALRAKGVEIIDQPCPFIRRVRQIFEKADTAYQYVFLCEKNHLLMKNFASVFPKDMILVQMETYKERILEQQNGKPLRIIPYVTFLPHHSDQVLAFANERFPERANEKIQTSCLWVSSKASPIVEIDQLSNQKLDGVGIALLIGTPGSNNKSLLSLEEAIKARGLTVQRISSLREFMRYEARHRHDKVLLVRSPIPNQAEAPILAYIEKGLLRAWWTLFKQNAFVRQATIAVTGRMRYLRNVILQNRAKAEAAELGLLKDQYAAK